MADFLRDTIKDTVSSIDWNSLGLDVPFFFAGTPQAVSAELALYDDSQKFPMVYLYERLEETQGTYLSSIALSAKIVMLFITSANYEDWTIQDHYDNACELMRDYAEAFDRQLFQQISTYYREESTSIYSAEVNFGKYIEKRGYDSNVFNETVSGCAYQTDIKILESSKFCKS